jgi:hypothetical protein
MSKKLYGLISTLVTAAGMIADAFIVYCQPANYGAWLGAITIAVPAINDILLLFVKEK